MRNFSSLLLLFTAALLSGGCFLGALICPAPPPLLSELDWSTPQSAVDTYRKAFTAGNANYEYLCLSNKLLEKYGIGATEYNLGRDRFLAENRNLVDLFLEADQTPPRPLPGSVPEQVVVRLQKNDHHADFLLVNEPVLWVSFEEDGDSVTMEVPLEGLSSMLKSAGNRIVIHDLPPGPYAVPLDSINKVTLTKRWRLMDIIGYSTSLKQALAEYAPKAQKK